VRFREDDVDAVAAALGLPVWPDPRPKPVMWLAIDDGSGPRLVGLQQNNVARPTLQRAIERGFRLGLPTGNAAEQAAVVVGPDGPITAGPRGVYRVVRVVLTAPGGVAAVQRPEVLPPVGELVMVALRRTGVDIEPLLLQRAMLRSLLAPQLGLEGSLTQRHDLHADIPGAANTGSSAQVWIIRLDLCFGACGSSSSTIATDAADYIADDSQFVVIEGEAYLADDVGSYSAASANVAERISKYRSDIAQTVSGLYYSRQRLTRERAGISGLPLREQVDHEIGIQEVTARLDAWTDGYFSQAIDGPDLE